MRDTLTNTYLNNISRLCRGIWRGTSAAQTNFFPTDNISNFLLWYKTAWIQNYCTEILAHALLIQSIWQWHIKRKLVCHHTTVHWTLFQILWNFLSYDYVEWSLVNSTKIKQTIVMSGMFPAASWHHSKRRGANSTPTVLLRNTSTQFWLTIRKQVFIKTARLVSKAKANNHYGLTDVTTVA